MRRSYLVAGTILAVSSLAVFRFLPSNAEVEARFSNSAQSSRWGKEYLPNVPVVDQDGNTFHFYDDLVKGKKVIINFIFTTCTDVCPLTTARLAVLQEKLGDSVGRDYFMYSITIDPEHDTPEQLKRHTEAFRVKPGWRFLTGNPRDIAEIRYKLGERSRVLPEHRHELLLGNDANGDWSKDSAFGDLDRLAMNIHAMDPDWRNVATSSNPLQTMPETLVVEDKPGEGLFVKTCAACHTIGGGNRIGPDLHHVSSRRDQAWVKRFIMKPDRMFAEKEPVAMQLAAQFPGVRMPNLSISDHDADDLLAYIDAKSHIADSRAQ
jgi:protein SCO1